MEWRYQLVNESVNKGVMIDYLNKLQETFKWDLKESFKIKFLIRSFKRKKENQTGEE